MSLSYPLDSWLNSELRAAAFWGQQDIFTICSLQYRIRIEKREAPDAAREGTASSPHGWPSTWCPQTTVGTQQRTGQACFNNHVFQIFFFPFVFLEKFYASLNPRHSNINHFTTPALRYDRTWSLQSPVLVHKCFQPPEFRLAVRKCKRQVSPANSHLRAHVSSFGS